MIVELESMKLVLGSLERLMLEVSRRVAALEAREREDHGRNGKESEGEDKALEVGESVQVVRRDRYYGRVGQVMGRQGNHYWDV